jgi:putative spermidine/putrescine transport system substrate-binding protein
MSKQLMIIAAICVVVSVMAVAPAQAAQSLIVARYGGDWGDTIDACILEPFSQATGIQITPEPGVSNVTLAKLKRQKTNPVIDVAWLDGGISELAEAAGLVAPIDPAKVSNINNMIDEGIFRNKDGDTYALSTGFYSLGLVYNKEDVENPPNSWWGLWNQQYEGVVTVPSPANAMGVPFLMLLNRLAGGNIDNFQPLVDKMRKLNVSSYFDSSGAATSSFQSGQVVIGAHYSNAAWAMADKGLPIGFKVPEEGALAGGIRVHIVKGTDNLAAAQKLVNYAVSKEAATCMTNKLYVGPATKGAEPSPEATKRLPWGPAGSVDDLVFPDWNQVNANRDRITKIFNRQILGH